MKKIYFFIVSVLITGNVFSGGLITNTNQSASWVRMPARNASTGIDATYYNPAGLMHLKNGFHLSLSNQSISQKREVENFYSGPGDAFGLNNSLFKGSVSAPLFPSAYAVYKMDRFAFSFGFNPVGGGGGATFESGLPSFEMSPSDLVPVFSQQAVNAYRLNSFFEGSSIFLGYQGGISYKINEIISVFAGVRYVSAKNSYQGYLSDIELYNFEGNGIWTRADLIIYGVASQAGNAKNNTAGLISNNLGHLTFAEAESNGYISSDDKALLEGALTAFGGNPEMTINTANTVFATAEATYNATATLLNDQEADVDQTGTGITPVFGVNISLNRLNIGLKYELATKLELQNNTRKDVLTGFSPTGVPVTMFPDEAIFRNDMPAKLSAGASYQLTTALNVNIGSHYYFDKNANYGKKINGVYVENSEVIDKNFLELAAGLEYRLSNYLMFSGGYLLARTGVNQYYQTDISNSQTSNTIGLGGKYSFNPNLAVNIGAGYTMYDKTEKTFDHTISGAPMAIPVRETYWKNTMFIGVGVDFSF